MVVHRIGVAVELTMSLQQATAIRAKAPEEGIPLKDIVDSIGGGEVVEVRRYSSPCELSPFIGPAGIVVLL